MRTIKLLNVLCVLIVSSTLQAEECISLSQNDVLPKNNVIVINSSGNYCISGDIKLTERSYLNHGWELMYDSPTNIALHASNLEINLKQNMLYSNSIHAKAAQGISIFRKNNIIIKDGRIESKSIKAIGVMYNILGYISLKKIDEFKKIRTCYLDNPSCEDISYLNSIDKLPPQYQDAHITIDNMNIFATYRGVQLADNHNTIRNSTIEVDDNTAIYLMGQYPIIENNTIIIHSNKNGDTETQKKYNIQIKDGAIKLRDAKGGIIRNNRIIYKGGVFSVKAPAAINLLDSKDVLIEGNTIEGFDKLVRENGDTSYTEKNNKIR
jgi:parallel beta helix pectate lyase-like protein